ncbi:adenylyltransferase/cytidyltransferase family protein [Patescibacteria group bacterium]
MKREFLKLLEKGIPLHGGLRKRCFLIKNNQEKWVFSLWPEGSLSSERIRQTIKKELLVKEKGLPARQWEKIGGRWLIRIWYHQRRYWLGVGNYLPGQTSLKWSGAHLQTAGQMLARLHNTFRKRDGNTLIHLDFARGNVLFDKEARVIGILDFEESVWGKVEKDLGCSLSFLVVDNSWQETSKIWGDFLKGYTEGGGSFDYDRVKKHYQTFLRKRMKDSPKKAFIQLARQRLETLQGEIKAKIFSQDELTIGVRKQWGKRVVFTVGSFELLHWGHLEYLERAKAAGSFLVVGVTSDKSRRRVKGKPYPLISDRTRAETLAHLKVVDAVIVVAGDRLEKALGKIRPDVFFTTKDDWEKGIRNPKEEELVRKWGGRVVKTVYSYPQVSSSQLAERVALLKIRQVLFSKVRRQPMLRFKKEKRVNKFVRFRDLEKLEHQLHRAKKTIVFASLTADLFHLGHARFILKARSLGDVLVIGVPSNRSVTILKGVGRPMIDEKARALVLAKLRSVDRVVVFDERTVLKCLKKLKPDVFFTVREDWNTGLLNSPEACFIKSIKGKIVRSVRQAPYLSASKMINKAAGEVIQKKFEELLRIARETPVLDADQGGFDPHSRDVQLAARENGFYQKVLEAVAQRGKCVFCDLKKKYLVAEKNKVVLTVALYPYTDGHLLIIPRRHLESVDQLTALEQTAIFDLTSRGKALLNRSLKIANFWLLIREGNGIKAGKTVDHLHFHLLPYDPRVIRMADTTLKIAPLKLAQILRKSR